MLLRPRITITLLLAGLAVLGGCGTCVSFEATYDEAWQATRAAILAQPELRNVASPFEARYETGTFDATVMRPSLHDELQYHAEVTPVGGEERAKRKVCVWVQQIDTPDVSDGTVGYPVKVQSRRRRDLEKDVARHIDRAFAVPEADEEAGDQAGS